MRMTDEEVLTILDLVEKSNFTELHLQNGDFSLTLIKAGADAAAGEKYSSPARSEEKTADFLDTAKTVDTKTADGATAAKGVLTIKAPVIGTFYAMPEPGAPPFVEPGAFVEEESTVCLIETMKVFTSVKAGVRGYIEEVLVENTQMVEYGQVLFKVRPE